MKHFSAITFITVYFCVSSMIAIAQPTVQDCVGAIPICSDSITISFNHNGMGNVANEIANVSGCYATEQRSVWFKFTVQQAGVLRFEINPLNANQDHDWTLFNMTNTSCGQLSTVAGASSAMVRSNTWGVFGLNGPTGVSTPNGGIGTCNGPGNANGPKWCADLTVPVGNTYYLHITNWTGSVYGFTIDFSSSTAVLFDNIPPAMDSISSTTNCHVFDSLIVDFDEKILCSSVQAGDFALIGPSGAHTITSAAAYNCLGTGANSALVHFTPPVSVVGQYHLAIKPGAGFIEDLCGNLDTLDTISFYFDGAIETDLSVVNLQCYQECEGEVGLSIIGGTSPFSIDWSNTTSSGLTQSGLCSGVYSVTVEDAVGCIISDSIEVEEPQDIVTSLVSKYKISCPFSTNCDGGATVTSTGGVGPFNYLWSSGEIGSSASALCAGINSVTITDANGCLDTFEVDIEIPDSMLTTGAGNTMICISNITNIAASAIGGTPPYNYIWREGSLSGQVISTSQITGVSPDTTTTYFVQVVDNNGCIGDTAKVTIKVRPPLGLVFTPQDTICPYDTIDLTVQGTGGDSIYTYSWAAGGFGPSKTVSPDEPIWYSVQVSDLCGTPAFTDSIFIQVGGYSAIDAELRPELDSICFGKSIYVIAAGRGGFRGPDEYVFDWGHTEDQNPIQFVKPGSTKSYQVTISDLCLSEPGVAEITIHVGNPETPSISVSPELVCGPSMVVVEFENFNESSSYEWIFSDGSSYQDYQTSSIERLFSSPGCYDLTINANTAYGCFSATNFDCIVRILPEPIANFEFEPSSISQLNPFAKLVNTSINNENSLWVIDGDTIHAEDQTIERFWDYIEVDSFVLLVVYSTDGCTDTVSKRIPFGFETTLYYPKSFTPNSDGLNDEFGIKGEFIQVFDFELSVYDRWGKLIFLSKDPQDLWNGKSADGEWLPIGSYPFVLRYRDHTDELRVIRDHVIISKSGAKRGLR